MAEVESKKCAHSACQCLVPKDEKYCSEYCKAAKDATEIACNCGHPECGI